MAGDWLSIAARQAARLYETLMDYHGYTSAQASAEADLYMEAACEDHRKARQQRQSLVAESHARVTEVLEGLPDDLRAIMEGVV